MARRLLHDFSLLLVALGVAIALRLFVFGIYTIPSESMLPRLAIGDYLLVAKWPYGWAGDGGPLARQLWRGRLLPRPPARGDIVVFKAPPAERVDYVKRVIGLPGDRVAMVHGVVAINGRPVARTRIADLIVPITPNSPCRPEAGTTIALVIADGRPACRYRRYRETLPEGRRYAVLDLGDSDADEFGPVTVPAGHLFLLGDNRDRSADSRFPARDGGAIGMVPMDDLVGRPLIVLLSVDGSARLADSPSWLRALRTSRLFAAL